MKIGSATPAIVTGGASGLGAAVVRALAARDAPVSVMDLNERHGNAIAEEVGGVFLPTDVTDDAQLRSSLDRARSTHGQERICVNCAGVAPVERTVGREGPHDMGVFSRTIEINLIGTFRMLSASAAGMAEARPLEGRDGEKGVIVNTASIAAFDGQMGQAAYAASKGGVHALTLPVARDLAKLGIRVIAIAPGIFETPMLAGLPEEVQRNLRGQVPYPRRLGDPEEFADMVCGIISNRYINGETIRLDGGLRMAPR